MPTRREFLAGSLATTVMASSIRAFAASASCPFRLAVINDEIGNDFDHACYVASHDFGLSWIELRSINSKTLADLSSAELDDARKTLARYKLRVTDIASPLFKTDLPGAPLSKHSPHHDQFNASFDYKAQDELLTKCIELARQFDTDRIRCFDFWRLEDQKPYRAEINRKLREAAQLCASHNVVLLLENEMACNTGTGEEALAVLDAIPNQNFMLNWDPGNAATFPGNVPYPDAYEKLPRKRIGHCHVKNVVRQPADKFEWQPVDQGLIDWAGQFKALQHDGYHYGVSLETHWRGGGTPEQSTRRSMQGMKECLAKAGIQC